MAPEALNASTIASRVAKPSLPAASMPPAAKKFLAKVARAVKSVGPPRLARKIFGRAPVRAYIRSEASRSASNGSARRMRGNGSNADAEDGGSVTGATSSTDTGVSARSGKSLVPVNASLRRATAAWRAARTAATFCWIMPCSSAAHAPPARSISWNWVQAARQSCSVMSSTPPAPAAGSVTRARFDSSSRTSWVLRAIRRANRSGRPSAMVNGSTVMASAPPRPAATTAMVARNMFT